MFTQEQQQLIDVHGFNANQITRLLNGENGVKNVNAVIRHVDTLLALPLNPEAITVLADRPTGYACVNAVIEYQDIVLNFGLQDAYDLLCEDNGSDEFLESLVEPIRQDQSEFDYTLESFVPLLERETDRIALKTRDDNSKKMKLGAPSEVDSTIQQKPAWHEDFFVFNPMSDDFPYGNNNAGTVLNNGVDKVPVGHAPSTKSSGRVWPVEASRQYVLELINQTRLTAV